jgi:hypothetical protein
MKTPNLAFKLLESPPYCPNPACAWHHRSACAQSGRFTRQGSRAVGRFPYRTLLWMCARRGRKFSDSIFYLFYRDRTEPTYEQIFHYHGHGQSRRAIAKDLGCSLDTVQRRFQELARQGLLIQADKTRALKIREPVAYDGIENFAFSQYDPNNINHAIGRKSFFLYEFNFSPLNRKGRMSQYQKVRDSFLADSHGRYPADSIQKATRRVIERLLMRTEGDLQFHSDNHYAYRRAIRSLPQAPRLIHLITPAKVGRNTRNRLFAINHSDNLTRHQLTTFKRETIAFAKHSLGMIESFTLFMVWKNFLRTCFVKKQKRDPLLNIQSPAMKVGIEARVLTFREYYQIRLQPTQVTLNEDWDDFVHRRDRYSRQVISAA